MNELKEKLGIDERTPIEVFMADPTPENLSKVGKPLQTREMATLALEMWDGHGRLLKHVSRKLMTGEFCMKACAKNGLELEDVPDRLLSTSLCLTAVAENGSALRYVPEEMRGLEMCLAAVRNDRGHVGLAMKCVPRSVVLGPFGRDLCSRAVRQDSMAIAYVPPEYVTEEMADEAVRHSYPGRWENCAFANGMYLRHEPDWPIGHIPERVMSRQLAETSVALFPASIESVPVEYVTEDMALDVLSKSWEYLRFVPEPFNGKRAVVDFALRQSPLALRLVPEKKRTRARCFRAKEQSPDGVDVRWFPERIRDEWNEGHPVPEGALPFEALLPPRELALPESLPGKALAVPDVDAPIEHAWDEDGNGECRVCYISDVHIDHQLDFGDCQTLQDAEELIAGKVSELNETMPPRARFILVAGDVSDRMDLTCLFYRHLYRTCPRRVIGVLGNHEFWDAHAQAGGPAAADSIVASYKEAIEKATFGSSFLFMLENEVYLRYKGVRDLVIDEQTLLDCDAGELRDLCADSTTVVLGGCGFSGRNPVFNASAGLYRDAIDRKVDLERSERFGAVHAKMLACAGDIPIIVMTHTPVENWLPEPPNPGWIYVNGHTHRNGMVRDDDGTTVLFDNQVGYEPRRWHMNSFAMAGRYDPFRTWGEGKYEIEPAQYIDFNLGRGIGMCQFKRPGEIIMLKRAGTYMFLLKSQQRLYLLEGGRIHRLEHAVDWYYTMLPEYARRVTRAFGPYRDALEAIADEVRRFGGSGNVHGCIVDIDFWNHVYLNPFDGTMTPYYAVDMKNKTIYPTVGQLLARNPLLDCGIIRFSDNARSLLERFERAESDGKLTALSEQTMREGRIRLPVVPVVVLDKTMYEPSRIMRSVQYVLDQHVVRIWRDEVLGDGADGARRDESGNHLLGTGSG